MIGHVHSIESFGTVDGPGIRFVVFLQGCPMRCLYCHNPDTWNVNGGREMSADELIYEYNRNKDFYSKGGITVTGGEPLIQIEFVTELFTKAKQKGIHTCLDTSGVTFNKDNHKDMDALMSVTDLVLLDIKHINNQEHFKLTGHKNDNILEFALYLSDKNIPVWIRHVVVPTITDDENYLRQLGRFLTKLKNVKALDVLPYHNMGEVKYESLGMDYPLKGIKPLEKDKAVNARNIILDEYKHAKNEK